MQVSVSAEISQILDDAIVVSAGRRERYVGVEHVFLSLLSHSSLLPPRFHEKHIGDLQLVAREIERELWSGHIPGTVTEVFYTPRCAAAANEAARLAKRFGASEPKAGHLMLAILADAHAAPSRVMDALALPRGEIIRVLRAELCKDGAARTNVSAVAPAAQQACADERAKADTALATLTRDLIELAQRGRIEPAIGRDKEIYEVLEILFRRGKNNVMLVGEAGVGKTKVVEGLAWAIANRKLPGEFCRFHLIELNLAALMAGTQYRGVFEEKITGLLERLKSAPDTVLFIDEVHLIMGAGATGEGSMDLANLLKPTLARGEIRCIGATTIAEYRKFIEKDPAIERRFQMVRVEPMSETATYLALKSMRPALEKHHGIRIEKEALRAAISLTQRYLPNRNLPDKAIDVLDQACARMRLRRMASRSQPDLFETVNVAGDSLTPHDIRKVVSQVAAVPIEDITADERQRLGNLERALAKEIIGQDAAVKKAVAAVRKSRAGIGDPNRPDSVMLFLGPTGVGKTQLCKALAKQVFGATDHLIAFDMSEYVEPHSVSRLLGAPPGYVGHEEEGRLSREVRSKPFSIVLFDEIEKAHPNIFDIMLPILEEGRIKDNQGREISFKNCIIIFTSNVAANLLHRTETGAAERELMEELHKYFRPEFINRIDEIVPFYPLLFEDIRLILKLAIRELRVRTREKGIDVYVYQRAYEYLAEKGYNPVYGARELRRTVDRLVVSPISDRILSGEFSQGDIIEVRMENDELTFTKGDPAAYRQARQRRAS